MDRGRLRDVLNRTGALRPPIVTFLVAGLLVGCSGSSGHSRRTAPAVPDPARTVAAQPDYSQACAPSGLDSSDTCIEVTLQAIDNARSAEGIKPMVLPSDFPRLSVVQQVFVAVNVERADRGLRPFDALSTALSAVADQGAVAARLPPDPGSGYVAADTEWIGAVANGLDADYEWVYDDGPGSGVPGCTSATGSSCWADRHNILDDFGAGPLVMGAALEPTRDTGKDTGGPSLAVELASVRGAPGATTYTWAQAQADTAAGTLRPRSAAPTNQSATGIPDPVRSVAPKPDFTTVCAPSGIDSSASCIAAVLDAVNAARAAEGVKPMVLSAGFTSLTVPEQLLVAVNLERIDRGLAPFAGLTDALDRNAQRGADTADDPPDPGSGYTVADTEWAGGSSNGLDAVYGWMYDDGLASGNLDCPRAGAPGCWGHRHGILDAFGTVGALVMGAAVNEKGDRTSGDKGGTSIAATLAVSAAPPDAYVFAWTPTPPPSPPGSDSPSAPSG
jgi:hypothetical protein